MSGLSHEESPEEVSHWPYNGTLNPEEAILAEDVMSSRNWRIEDAEIWARISAIEAKQGTIDNQLNSNTAEIARLRDDVPKIHITIGELSRQFASLSSSGSAVAIEARHGLDMVKENVTTMKSRLDDFIVQTERQQTGFGNQYDKQNLFYERQYNSIDSAIRELSAKVNQLRTDVDNVKTIVASDVAALTLSLNALRWWVKGQSSLTVALIGAMAFFIERLMR